MAGKPLHIGIVTPTLSRAGGGLFPIVLAHARHLSGHDGLRVSVFGVDDDRAGADRDAWAGLSVRRYRASRFARDRRLPRDLCDAAPDLVHQHGIWRYPSVAVSGWRRRGGKPVVISPHGMLDPWALRNSALRKRIAGALFERRNLAGAACIHALGAPELAAIRAYGLLGPVALVPNGTDLAGTAAPGPRPSWMPDGRRTLLFLGRIHPKKGIAELLRGFARFRALSPEAAGWRLAIVGWDDGGHLDGLRGLAATLGIADAVTFPGPLFGAEKAAALHHADAFVLPSFSEGLPASVLEAWSHALPVLMTRACNLPEGFAAGAAIEIATDPDAMARALVAGLTASDLAAIGRRGRALVAARFAWPGIAAEIAAVYAWACGRGPGPACIDDARPADRRGQRSHRGAAPDRSPAGR